MSKPRAELTRKQRLFVEAYCGQAKGNATEAARLAGYAAPMQQGSRLLRNVEVSVAIRDLDKKSPAVMSPDEIRETWTKIAKGEFPEFDSKDRVAVLRDLARSSAMFVERHEITGAEGGPVEIKQELDYSQLSKAQLRDLSTLLAAAKNEPPAR